MKPRQLIGRGAIAHASMGIIEGLGTLDDAIVAFLALAAMVRAYPHFVPGPTAANAIGERSLIGGARGPLRCAGAGG